MVIDTSVMLALFFAEPAGAWAAGQLTEHAASLRMSTVNLAETLIRNRDRQPSPAVTEACPILTVERDFRAVDRPVLLPAT